MFRIFCLCLALVALPAAAEIGMREGVTPVRKLPPVQNTAHLVRLDVPQVSQGRDPICVPTSAAMILAYYGAHHDKWALKRLAESHKPKSKRNADFTYWADMQKGLRKLGSSWQIRSYPRSDAGFDRGLRDIRAALRKGRPVMIDVHLDVGHTFVVTGFDDAGGRVFIRDPLLTRSQMRVLSYATLRENWHNHRFGPDRSAFFTQP